MGRSRQLDLAMERSIAGEVRPCFYQGRKCGETIRYNDSLALAVLKLLRRERRPGPRGSGTRGIIERKGFRAR